MDTEDWIAVRLRCSVLTLLRARASLGRADKPNRDPRRRVEALPCIPPTRLVRRLLLNS
eukprot:SAG11_NODE_19694_length_461_cov_0.701657_1_plen_58_part_10